MRRKKPLTPIPCIDCQMRDSMARMRPLKSYDDSVRAVCEAHPDRVHWYVREDGRPELRIHGDGVIYNFTTKTWDTSPPYATVMPDSWRLPLEERPVDA